MNTVLKQQKIIFLLSTPAVCDIWSTVNSSKKKKKKLNQVANNQTVLFISLGIYSATLKVIRSHLQCWCLLFSIVLYFLSFVLLIFPYCSFFPPPSVILTLLTKFSFMFKLALVYKVNYPSLQTCHCEFSIVNNVKVYPVNQIDSQLFPAVWDKAGIFAEHFWTWFLAVWGCFWLPASYIWGTKVVIR